MSQLSTEDSTRYIANIQLMSNIYNVGNVLLCLVYDDDDIIIKPQYLNTSEYYICLYLIKTLGIQTDIVKWKSYGLSKRTTFLIFFSITISLLFIYKSQVFCSKKASYWSILFSFAKILTLS